MITASRKHIQIAKESLLIALVDSTVGDGKKWRFPNVSDDTLEKAVMTALTLIAMDALNPHEVVIPSDIVHIDNFGKDIHV